MEDFEATVPPKRAREPGNNNENYTPGDFDPERTIPNRRMRREMGDFSAGDVIADRYQVVSILGRGAMGVVYRCFDRLSSIEVALKGLPPELAGNDWEFKEIKNNFQLVHKLHHPNIANYNNLEFDLNSGGYFLVMEFVDGVELRTYMENNRPDHATIIKIISQIAAALDYAHAQQILHRDIKPGNIMIDRNGIVKILDFGLAAQIHSSMSRVSREQDSSGTAPYMSPEQWRGRRQNASCDQYALGVVAYEMFAGFLPFESTDPLVLKRAVLDETPEPLANVTPSIQYAVNKALGKTPEERFPNCTAFAQALTAPVPVSAAGKRKLRIGIIMAVIGILVILLGGGIGAFLALQNHENNNAEIKKISDAEEDDSAIAKELAEAKLKAEQAEAERKEAERKEQEAEKLREEAERKAREAEEDRSANERKKKEAEEQLKEAERKAREAAEQRKEAERKAKKAEEERLALERKAREAERKAREEEEKRKEAERKNREIEEKRKEEERKAKEAERKAREEEEKRKEAERKNREIEEKRKEEERRKKEAEERAAVSGSLSGQTFTAQLPNGVKLEMVRIPNCKKDGFMMGSDDGDGDEKPRHKVYLTEDFYLGKYEVTQAQWQALMGTDVYQQKNKGNAYGSVTGVGGQHPMYFVNYKEALDFCNRLTARGHDEGWLDRDWKFTLPTEAQWEYACRAGTTTAYSYGDSADSNKMNYSSSSTLPVGSKRSYNNWDLYDMHGNVWEWCLDSCNYESARGIITNTYNGTQTDPLCTTGSLRVLRGGGWSSLAQLCRSANRDNNDPSGRDSYVGFRLALVQIDEEEQKEAEERAAVSGSLSGQTFTVPLPNGVKLEMVRIPNCKKDGFMMGSPSYEDKRESDETQHRVYLTRDFYLGKYEVTQAQWQALMGTDVYQQKNKGNAYGSVSGVGGQHPMYFVNYNEALDFCNRLTARGHAEGWLDRDWKFTLPTEAQWEYACRAGTITSLNSGENMIIRGKNNSPNLDAVGWYGGNCGQNYQSDSGTGYDISGWSEKQYNDRIGGTHPVGKKRANNWNLYDMHGNVFEWCLDSCNGSIQGNEWIVSTDTYRPGIQDPLCTSGSYRVFRGGSCGYYAQLCRSAFRGYNDPTYRLSGVGFRLALVQVD